MFKIESNTVQFEHPIIGLELTMWTWQLGRRILLVNLEGSRGSLGQKNNMSVIPLINETTVASGQCNSYKKATTNK